ncbi:GAF domain-containing protein [Marinigracilibium pacificum]|uniref:GAF domain-containing protein n=1 Tax=Marinigracilibium pacificum TaxID=2729599 RepID=A0A848JBJ9_9BACT|nr:GAF domain-containing protein [Marinigracilibium pacificum]NMM50392.1 GAF domain-containing protein [Marinigracilibium pacificum]
MDNKYKPFFDQIYNKSNRVLETLLIGYFIFGIGIAFIYDTFLVGVLVGSLNLALYFSAKFLFKETRLNQYIGSLVAGIFMAQFIYQMHGLFEMHFTAFIAIIALIAYQNKYAFIPQFLLVVIHHSIFAYIQYLGSTEGIESYQQIYFTQLDYMDFSTFLFHAGLYSVGIAIAVAYTYQLEQSTKASAENIISLKNNEMNIQSNIDFANEIAKGNLDLEFTANENDKLAIALLNMRENIRESALREKQEKFITEGIAEVSDIVRSKVNDLESLSDSIVSYLVNYLDANQAGLFIRKDDNSDELELKACYAYQRKKFINKSIMIGEGLVGQCYLERERIYLKDVPSNYMQITSGLGESSPREILILPVKTDKEIIGILEIATLKKFEDKHHKFLNRVSETIAATISSSKLTQKTQILLEQSQQQTEEMRAQEEEMRQNMEELSATQEEMRRNSSIAENQLKAISNSNIGMIEFDTSGNVLDANQNFCDAMKYSKEQIVGRHHRMFVSDEYSQSEEYSHFWDDLRNGLIKSGEFVRYKSDGEKVILYGAYSVIRNDYGNIEKIIKLAFDITEYTTNSKAVQQS